MGTRSVLQLSLRLLFLVSLTHGAAIRSDAPEAENANLVTQDVCPCVIRADCPRAFGSKPEDGLLGSFPPCEDPDLVRCCGVSTSVNIEHSTSNGAQKQNGPRGEPVIPPGVEVPVPISFPEYVDPRTSTIPPESPEEYEYYYEDYPEYESEKDVAGTEKSVGEERGRESSPGLRGENIGDKASRTDASSVFPDRLDYPTVTKRPVEGDGVQTTTGTAAVDGAISSSKSVAKTSTSSTSTTTSVKKTESIVTSEDSSSSASTLSELPAEEYVVEADMKDGRTARSGMSDSETLKNVRLVIPVEEDLESAEESRGKIVAEKRREISSQRKSEKVTKESTNVEETSSTSVRTANEQGDDVELIETARRPSAANVGVVKSDVVATGRESLTRVANQQKRSSVRKETNKVEENSSNVESVAAVTGEEQNVRGRRRRIQKVNSDDGRKSVARSSRRENTSSQQQSTSVKKESSSFEGNTSSNIRNVGIDAPVRRPTVTRGNVVYGQNKETSVQKQSSTVKKESSTVEEETSSNVQNTVASTGVLLDDDSGSGAAVINRRPIVAVGRPTVTSGNVVYGQNKETSVQKQSSTVKKESSTVEENTSSTVQNTVASTGKLLDDADSISEDVTPRPVRVVRRRKKGRGNDARGSQNTQTFNQKQSSSVKKESSTFEENTSSNAENIATNTELVDTSLIGALEKRRESSNRKESKSVKKESSTVEESSNIQTSNTAQLSRDELTSIKKSSKTEKKESSSVEEKTSSNVSQTTITDTQSNGSINEPDQNQGLTINQQTTPGLTDNTLFNKRVMKTSQTQTNSKVSSESTISRDEKTTLTSTLSNLVKGQGPLGSKVVPKPLQTVNIDLTPPNTDQRTNGQVWRVANRTYVPVLINAGFLRDRPTSTGTVGLDPLSGVTHTDIWNPELARELLPLSCGNVVFGERFEDGRTLVCDIPHDNVLPIRFVGSDDEARVSAGKLDGPILPEAILPDRETTRVGIDDVRDRGSVRSKAAVTETKVSKTKTESTVSESRSAESSDTTIVEGVKTNRQRPLRRRVVVRSPVPLPVPDRISPTSPQVGSRHVSRESSSTSSSSSTVASSIQETNANDEITKSEFDVTSADEYDATKETDKKNSKFYLFPLAPILPRPDNVSPESTASFHELNAQPEAGKIVEVIDDAPASRTRVTGKRVRNLSSGQKMPPKELEVLTIKRSEDNGASVEEAKYVIPAESLKKEDFFYNRNSRQAKGFAPDVKSVTISPEELSAPGRIDVIGPIPKGYKDPALEAKEKLGADQLPVNARPHAAPSAESRGKKIADKGAFKASPVDPIYRP